MSFDFEGHEKKLRSQREAEIKAKEDHATKLRDAAKLLREQAVQYAQTRNPLDHANIDGNTVKLIYSHATSMTIEVLGDNEFHVRIDYDDPDDNLVFINTGDVVDKDDLRTMIVDFVEGKS